MSEASATITNPIISLMIGGRLLNEMTVNVRTPGYPMESFPLDGLCVRGNIATPEPFDIFRFDMRRLSFASISQIVAIAQLYVWANHLHADVSLGDIPPDVEQYASRMDLYKLIGVAHRESFARHMSDDRFVPLRRITDYEDVNAIAADLTNVVMRRLTVDESVRNAVDFSFGEILDNIVQHSGSPIGGVAAAQYYPNKHYLELCVSDSGRGIPSTMASNCAYRSLTSSQLMAKAFEEGCGERVGAEFLGQDGAGMGMGLTIAERFVRKCGGIMWVVSSNEAVTVTSAGVAGSKAYWYPGTILVMRVPTNMGTVINADDIYPGRGYTGRFSWNKDDGFFSVSDDGGADNLLW